MRHFCPKVSYPTVKSRQTTVSRFMADFTKHVRPWFVELVAKYKAHGEFDAYPTYIEGFYSDSRDKEVALLSTLCMNWESDIHAQVEAMRSIMGEHPCEWFRSRMFTAISIGREQDNRLDGGGAAYWKIARFFDRLYGLCRDKDTFELSKVFPASRSAVYDSKLEHFAKETCSEIEYADGWMFKTNVVELILRTSDGLGLGLWKGCKAGEKCPRRSEIYAFMKMWISDYSRISWDFGESVSWFGLERESDFFYMWMAWKRLMQIRPKECSKFSNIFWKRYSDRLIVVKWKWIGYLPEIDFDEDINEEKR